MRRARRARRPRPRPRPAPGRRRSPASRTPRSARRRAPARARWRTPPRPATAGARARRRRAGRRPSPAPRRRRRACAQRATSRPVRSSAPAHAALATAKSAKPPAPIARTEERRGRALEGDQRDGEHDGVDADDRGDALDGGVELAQDVGQRERHDRRVGQAEARGDGEDVGADAHTRSIEPGRRPSPAAKTGSSYAMRTPRPRSSSTRSRPRSAGTSGAASRSASRRRTSCPARAARRRRWSSWERRPAPTRTRRDGPFVGRAGAILDDLLGVAGLAREDVFITNVVKARPPGNRDPRADEIAHHLPFLEAQLEVIRPRLLVPLGRHALKRFAPDMADRRGPRPRPRARRAHAVPDVPPGRGAAQPAPAADAGRRRAGAAPGAVKPIHVGCSGWNYADWRGVLYPRGCPQRSWLQRYAEASTPSRSTTPSTACRPRRRARMGEQTPPGFIFAVKSSRYLTHIKRLTDMDRGVERLLERLEPLTALAQDGPDAVAAARQLPPRRRAPGLRPRAPAARPPRLRVPPRELVRRRRAGARCAPTASRSSSATTPSAHGSPTNCRPTSPSCACTTATAAGAATTAPSSSTSGRASSAAGAPRRGLRLPQQRLGGIRGPQCSGATGAPERVRPPRIHPRREPLCS